MKVPAKHPSSQGQTANPIQLCFNRSIRRLCILLICLLTTIYACGSSQSSFEHDIPTQQSPIIMNIDPTQASAGEQITISGIGFSSSAPNNIIMLNDAAIPASTYDIITNANSSALEQIEFILPDDLDIGDNTIVVIVYDHTSNADFQLEVMP